MDDLLSHIGEALLRLYEGSVKALLRQYEGCMKAYRCEARVQGFS